MNNLTKEQALELLNRSTELELNEISGYIDDSPVDYGLGKLHKKNTRKRKRFPKKLYGSRDTRIKGHEDVSLLRQEIEEFNTFVNQLRALKSLNKKVSTKYGIYFNEVVNRERNILYRKIKREVTYASNRRALIQELNKISL